MKPYILPPKKIRLVHINFTLESLRILVSAIDPRASRMCMRHQKGSDLTTEEEAEALAHHHRDHAAVLDLLRYTEANISKGTDPLVFLALAMEKAREGAQ